MRCSSCKPLLDRYAEGSLPMHRLARISAHLSGCGECCAVLEELKVVDGLLATMSAPPVPPLNFTFAVMAEVRALPVPAVPRSNVIALAGAYTLVAWAMIALWLQLSGIGVAGALTLLAQFAAQTAGSAHALTAAVSGVFGSGTPQVTAFVLTVLALDAAVGIGIAIVYFVVRPRLAARLASVRESS